MPRQRAVVGLHSAAQLRTLVAPGSLTKLLTLAWTFGIPVIQTRINPLTSKRMHAACGRSGPRYAVILSQETRFPAKASFAIAHELGHIFLGHAVGNSSLLDVEDPAQIDTDAEEEAANLFALELLTGSANPSYEATGADFNAPALAAAARAEGASRGIDPGIIVLGFAYQNDEWARGTAALQLLGAYDVGARINELATRMLSTALLHDDEVDYLSRLLGGDND